MKKTRKWFALMLAIVMIASVGLVGCGGDTEEGDGTATTEPQELHFLETAEPPSLDAQLSTDTASFLILNSVQEGLVRVGPNGIEPGMAESWEELDGGTRYVFKIRDNATWSNGDPLTAQDFVDGWERAINAHNASQYYFMITDYVVGAADYYNYTNYEVLKNLYDTNLESYKEAYANEDGTVPTPDEVAFGEKVENPQPVTVDSLGFKALDEHTLEVKLTQPTAWFLETTAFATLLPFNKKFYEEHKDNYATEKENLLYNGPWVISEWLHESKVVLTKNDQYWDKDNVKLDTITLDIVKDTSTALDLYESGAVDRVALSRENVPLYKDDPNFGTFGEMVKFYFVFNTTRKPFDNAKVRQAVSMVVDRQGYVDTVLNNGSTPAFGLVPEGFMAYSGSEQTFREASAAKYGQLFTDNNQEAKALLEAGLAESGMTLDEFSIEFLTDDTETARKSAEYLKSVWESSLGVKVDIAGVPFAERLNRSRTQQFDVVMSGWGPDYNDPLTWLFLFETASPYNDGKWSNAKYDELVAKAKTELDQEARLGYFMEAEKILVQDEHAIGPVYDRNKAYLQQPYVKGLYEKSFGSDFEFKWTYIEGKTTK